MSTAAELLLAIEAEEHSHALNYAAESSSSRTQLPILATANDVRELVQFLKKRPFGVSISDISQPIKKRVFFPKKVAAYEYWRLVTRSGEHLKLSQLGWEFARSLEPEARIYRTLLSETPAYVEVLAWTLDQRIDVIAHTDVVSFWEEHCPEFLLHADGKTAFATAVCFFHLCQAAELGTMTIGKRGQPARFRILRDELSTYLEQRLQQDSIGNTSLVNHDGVDRSISLRRKEQSLQTNSRRILISQGNSEETSKRIIELVNLEGISCDVVVRATESHGLISRTTVEVMRRCDSCVILITHTDFETPETLITTLRSEINAASVLYDGRVLLISPKSVRVPTSLTDVNWCEFDEAEITWESAVCLMKKLKEFVTS